MVKQQAEMQEMKSDMDTQIGKRIEELIEKRASEILEEKLKGLAGKK